MKQIFNVKKYKPASMLHILQVTTHIGASLAQRDLPLPAQACAR